MKHEDYEAQAGRFLKRYNLSIKTAYKGDKCPPWCDGKHIHGDKYRVTIIRHLDLEKIKDDIVNHEWDTNTDFLKAIHSVPLINRQTISFDFWNSLHDKQQGNHPTNYDILDLNLNL